MSSLLVIGVVVGLWSVVCLVFVAVCWAAQRGDEALISEGLARGPAIQKPVADAIPRRVHAPFRGMIGRPRPH